MGNATIGRKEEQAELLEAFNSKEAEFVVLYGRRRVGKTFLIEEFFSSKKCIFFHVTGIQKGLLKEQLAEFIKAISHAFYNGVSLAPVDTWMEAFEKLSQAIENIAKTSKVILFFDEFPWMVTPRSRLVSTLDYYWNQYWRKNNKLKLVICGSSASWIIKNIIYNKAGLHNRYTRSLLLKPFTLYETRQFFHCRGMKISDKQILQLYMCIGGIPHYLKNIKKNLSAIQNVNKLCFRENALLFTEFDKLFKSLFTDAKAYIELIRIISRVREGVPRAYIEDHSKLSSKGGTLTERLDDLEMAGFIKSFLPLSHQRQGVYYRVIDEYCYFYLRWIEPERQTLTAQEFDNRYWLNKTKSAKYNAWMGYAFEAVCYKHISQIRRALGIEAGTRVGVWRYTPRQDSNDQGAQIDLIFERDDDAVTLCEIKCVDKQYVIDKKVYNSMLNKINKYKQITRSTKQIYVAFIVANGLKKTVYSEELVDGVVTIQDIFKESR